MKELEAYRNIMTDLPEGILEAEAEAEKNDRISAGLIDGSVSGMSASDKTAIFVRASGRKTGTTYTQNLEADPAEVLLEALANAEYGQEEKPEIMNSAVKMSDGKDREHASLETLLQKAEELEKAIREIVPEPSHMEILITENLRTVGIVNSLGLDRTYTRRITEASLQVTMEKDVHRSLALETSAGTVAGIPVSYFTEKMAEWLLWPLHNNSSTVGALPAVLDGGVVCNILLTAWLMFSGYQYQRQNTPFYGKLGEKLFPPLVTLSDIPDSSDYGYGRSFDCEGSTCRRVDVVKDGIFKELMHNLATAASAGCESTGNAGRDVNLISDQTEVRVIPSHFTLCRGSSKKEDMLNRLEDGIYICESFDMFHCLNTAFGDYTIPCKGIRYQKGKPTGMVEGITLNGNLADLLKDIEMVADDRTTVSMVMSKSFEVSASSVYVKKVNISM